MIIRAPCTTYSGNRIRLGVAGVRIRLDDMQVNHRRRNYRNGSRISLVTARKFDWIAGS
jgi:hypothetical protein